MAGWRVCVGFSNPPNASSPTCKRRRMQGIMCIRCAICSCDARRFDAGTLGTTSGSSRHVAAGSPRVAAHMTQGCLMRTEGKEYKATGRDDVGHHSYHCCRRCCIFCSVATHLWMGTTQCIPALVPCDKLSRCKLAVSLVAPHL
jgi:hypothetical protein